MKTSLRFHCILHAALLAQFLLPAITSAAPPVPSAGSAVVDGNPNEWNLPANFFANMHRAGRADKPLESKTYFRYDCTTMTLYVLVLGEPGIPCLLDAGTAWVAINTQSNKLVTNGSGNDGVPPDFAWIDVNYDGNPNHARGYEASFSLAPGSYSVIVHVDVFDAGGGQTSATIGFPGSGPALIIDCAPVPVESTTWSRIKKLYD